MNWLRVLLSGKPHFIIGGDDNPYLLRWYLIPRNRRLNVYLHKIVRDDDDRALHDHPWWFVSIMIRGMYREITPDHFPLTFGDGYRRTPRRAPSIAYRPAEHQHRLVLSRDANGRPLPCWTIVITGRTVREWGFWCPQGFVSWKVFTDPGDSGKIGKGCGE